MRHLRSRAGIWLILILAFALVGAACGGGAEPGADTTAPPTDTTAPTTETTQPTDTTAPTAGELGTIEVAAGDPIAIATLQAISGPVASLGEDQVRGVEIAIEDFGAQLAGRDITLQVEDDLCSSEGGQTGAQRIMSDPQMIGIVGTSCSGAAVPASEIVADAGRVIISGSNTAPALTATGYFGEEGPQQGENFSEGYYRTSHNDEFQGRGAADFAFNELGLQNAVTIHDGDPYTQGLVNAFGASFEEFGGTVVLATAVNKGDTDMRPILTEVAAAQPDIVFFPIFQPEGDFIVQQAAEFPELDPRVSDVVFMGADGLLSDTFVSIPETDGMYFSGPAQPEGDTYNQFLQKYEEAYGEGPIQAFHAHAYDAATILLTKIEEVGQEDGDTLVIDLQALRDALYALEGFQGLTGTLSCNEFGDCADPRIAIFQNEDPTAGTPGEVIEAVRGNVVYLFEPSE